MRQFALVWLLALSLSIGCSRGVQLPIYSQVPAFRLISQDGQTFDSHQLNGHVWVANVMFTQYQDVCPLRSTLLHMLQSSTADLPQLKLVSISVDPLHDTPEVLAGYGRTVGADRERWVFLTGHPPAIDHVSRSFNLGGVDSALRHNTHLVLVDHASRIRGYYSPSSGDPIPQLVADARRLLS
jgi:cytochrome oxidase Cu insertion factor (SCO1/SenC/PrrC family)